VNAKKFLPFLLILLVMSLVAGCAAPAAAPAAPAADAPAAEEAAAGEADAAPVTITYLVDDSTQSVASADALVAAYTALHPNVTINVETRPQGSDGDNFVKTRLATGEMADVFAYNSGSLLQALQPASTLVDITNEPYIANIAESFLPTVSQDGKIYGVPSGTAMGGGILYNKKVYEELGLSVPKTWDEFRANNEAIAAAGIAPVIASFGDTWTSQLFVLADYYNLQLDVPTFADDYTANKVKYATTPAALRGFQYMQEGFEKGWWSQDFATMKYEQGLKLLADGEGAHFPMLSFALSTLGTNWPEQAQDIGFFGVPGSDPETAGATIWMPGGVYIPQTTENLEAAKGFQAFVASVPGTEALTAAVPPAGPYVIKGATLPDDVLPAVKDIAAYIDSGLNAPALEFLSPVKGPALEQLTVAVGTGQMTAEEAAAAYDVDVEKQAQQLGLEGW
jgi:raffinose/stachyose/melibiose transport system substrate-binding protein